MASTLRRRPIRRGRPGRGERGQAMVEFALLVPVLLLICMGALDFGRALNSWVVIHNAAREGAFYAAQRCTGQISCSNVAAVVETEAAPLLNSATVTNLLVTGPCKVAGHLEESDQVTVSYNYQLLTPLFGANRTVQLVAVASAPEGPGTSGTASGGTCS